MHISISTIPDQVELRVVELVNSLKAPVDDILCQAEYLSDVHFDNDLTVDPASYKKYLIHDGLGCLYGISSLVRAWINTSDRKLCFSINHSINIWTEKAHPSETKFGFPQIVWQSANSAKYIGFSNSLLRNPIVYIPSPVLIVKSLVEELNLNYADKSSIHNDRCLFFVSHSTNYIVGQFDLDEVSQIVLSLRKKYRYVDCVIYFLDTSKKKSLSKIFDRIYCCGHNLDPSFIVRIYRLIDSYPAISYNKVGTHSFYAASLGKRVLHYSGRVSLVANEKYLKYDGFSNPWFTAFESFFSRLQGQDVSFPLLMSTTYMTDISDSRSSLSRMQNNKLLKVYLFFICVPIKNFLSIANRLLSPLIFSFYSK